MSERKPAVPNDIAHRRLISWSGHWLPPPKDRPTSQNYKDRETEDREVSVSLWDRKLTPEEFVQIYKKYAAKLGVGFSTAVVANVDKALKEKGIEGQVLTDPKDGEPEHGIVTGENRKDSKTKLLREIFEVQLKPKEFAEVYPDVPNDET